MTNRQTNSKNVALATLTATMGPTDLTITVDSTATLPASPCYLVIDPDDDTKREVVYADGAFSGTTIAISSIGDRFLDGSAAGSGLTHDIGAPVIHASGLAQLWEDINDRVDAALAQTNPTGAVTQFAGSSAPSGWILCQGQNVNRTTYADLFAVIGTTYGVGDGSTTFGLPDLRERFPVGAKSGGDYDLADTGGAATVTLTEAQMPAHNHSVTVPSSGGHTHRLEVSSPDPLDPGQDAIQTTGSTPGQLTALNDLGSHTHTVTETTKGSSSAHENRPPFIALNYIIKT